MDDKQVANQLQRLSERLSRGLQRREWVRRDPETLVHLETGAVVFVDNDTNEVYIIAGPSHFSTDDDTFNDDTLLYRGPEPRRFLSALSNWLKAFNYNEERRQQMRLVPTGAQTISVDSETIPFTTTTTGGDYGTESD